MTSTVPDRSATHVLGPVRYREVFDGVQDIIYVRDLDGVLLDVNEAGARFFGVPREQLLGRKLHRHDDDEAARSLQATNELLFERGVDRSTVHLPNANGESRIVEATTALMRDDAGHAMGAYGVMRDVTESTGLLDSLARTNRELVRLTENLTVEKRKSETALADAERHREIAERATTLLAADHARKTRELDEARLLQQSLLASSVPRLPHLEVAVHMSTATEVGGDYYDFTVGKDGSLTVALGDATGHGLRAGILVATAKSYFHTLGRNGPLRDVLESMSNALRSLGNPTLYMCLMLIRIEERTASIVGAGMPSFLVRRANEVERVEAAGTPLGLHRRSSFDSVTISFEPGTTLLFFSDGLTELADESDRDLGYERIERALEECGADSAEGVLARIVALATEWRGGQPPADDVTVLVLRAK